MHETTRERSAQLIKLIHYWHTLTPNAVANIHTVYREDATFQDPFNCVEGLAAIQHIFSQMYVQMHDPKFTITESIEQGDTAMLFWDFTFRIKSLKPEKTRRIHGSSHIRFAPDGRVLYHRDYWDAAGELYEQLPLVGSLMRFLKKRMG